MKSIISFFKFTPTEAAGIKPLVENHFLLFWLYNIMDLILHDNKEKVYETSNFIYSFASIKRTSNRENDNE